MMRSFAGIGVIKTVHITDNSLDLKKKLNQRKKIPCTGLIKARFSVRQKLVFENLKVF